jgi:periplasmic divalent cation tolerance protein
MKVVNMRLVITTCSTNKSKELINEILKSRLAGCANRTEVNSKFWWKGKIDEEKESLIIFKTKEELVGKLFNKIKEIHPYEVPEIIEIKVEKVNDAYLKWLKVVTKGP